MTQGMYKFLKGIAIEVKARLESLDTWRDGCKASNEREPRNKGKEGRRMIGREEEEKRGNGKLCFVLIPESFHR